MVNDKFRFTVPNLERRLEQYLKANGEEKLLDILSQFSFGLRSVGEIAYLLSEEICESK